MNLKLTDKRALVSGSTKGIGLAIATALAREGARVVINGRTEASVSAALSEILGSVPNATIEGFAGDLAAPQAAELLGTKFPSMDILVNNLGIFEPKPFEQIPDDDWRRFFEVNVLSGVRLSRMYLPGMKDRGWGSPRGCHTDTYARDIHRTDVVGSRFVVGRSPTEGLPGQPRLLMTLFVPTAAATVALPDRCN